MRVFVFEHVVGGGAAGEILPAGLIMQGQGMHRAAVAAFLADGHEVVTTFDSRRPDLALLHACQAVRVDGMRLKAADPTFCALARDADVTLAIAPESDGCLLHWLGLLEQCQATHLGAGRDAVRLVGDKYAMAKQFGEAGLPTPQTFLLAEHDPVHLRRIIKLRDGAGCDFTACVHPGVMAEAVVASWPGQLLDPAELEKWIVQPFHAGLDVSVSLVVSPASNPLPMSARPASNCVTVIAAARQQIEHFQTSSYCGGSIPLCGTLGDRAIALALRAVDAVPGLRGFVGVDLVLGSRAEDDVIIEINPRTTISFIAATGQVEPSMGQLLMGRPGPVAWHGPESHFTAAGVVHTRIPIAPTRHASSLSSKWK